MGWRTLAIWLYVFGVGVAGAAPTNHETEALAHYQKGLTAFNLGHFDDAVREFEQAYELKQDPVFLFNIGQSYRQKGDGGKAVFFYKRYLASMPDAKNRAEVEARIVEIEGLAQKEKELREKPPDKLAAPTGESGPDVAPDEDSDEDDSDDADGAPAAPELATSTTLTTDTRRVRIGVAGGVEFVLVPGEDSSPAQPALELGVSYLLWQGDRVGVGIGAGSVLTPVSYQAARDGTVNLISALATATVRYRVAGKLSLAMDAGVGALFMTDLADGNPFSETGAAIGSQAMLALRIGVSIDYQLGGLYLFARPFSFAYSPASSALASGIDSVSRIDVLAGVGYAM